MRYAKEVEQMARKYGWSVRITNGGHFALEREGYPTMFASKTPGNALAIIQAEAKIKRAMRKGNSNQKP